MEIEVKQRNSQRNRRRERAQRILAQRESLASAKQQQNLHNHHNHNNQSRQRTGGGGGGGGNDDEDSHSGDDDEQLGLSRSSRPRDNHQRPVRPPRPPRPRKKTGLTGNSVKEPPFEEDIIDGFAILAFRTYEDLESAIKLAGKNNLKKLHSLLTIEEKPKVDTGQNNRHNDHHIKNHFKHNHYTHNSILTPSTLNQGLDAGTSDDSGRASEQLHGPGIPRDSQDADSSRDHLSDASSHCSSGKGYICDSEGEDDKGSDAESILFESSTPPLPRKYELPSSSPHVLPPANGAGGSPPDTGGQISNPATDAPAPIPPPVPASAPVPTVPSPPSPTLPPHISQPPMTSPLAANPRAIAPQQRPASPAHPPPSLPQQPHTTIPALHPPNVPLVSSSHNTTSPAVASLGVTPAAPSNGAATTSYPPSLPMAAYPQTQPSYPPLYTPYASLNHSPYLSPAVPSPSHSASSRADVRSSRASPHTNSISKPPLTNNVTNHNSSTPLSAATTTCVSTITNTVTTANTIAHRDIVTCSLAGRINNNNSPRGHSPNRERDSYSSNVSTLSRGSITPVSVPNTSSPANSSLPAYSKAQGWISSSTSSQLSPATGTSVPRPTPPPQSTALGMHNFPPPMFAAPLPPPVSSSSPHTSLPSLQPPTTNPNPFSAESLFQSRVTHVTGQTDMLRRELDNRFLASSQDRNVAVSNLAPPPYLRTEMHHHQHQHTHVHQHTTPLLPPPAATTLFPPPIFKDIPKLGSVDSPFFRGNLNLSSYPGFNTGLLHPGMGPSTPFVPPNHLTSFAPKKTGKWNAMHVRIAWEIYHHKQKTEGKGGGVDSKTELLRPPGHLYPGGPGGSLGLGAQSLAPPFPSNMPQNHPGAPPPPHPVGFLSTSASHLGTGMSPFGRYPASFGGGNPNFPTLSGFPPTREMSQLSGLTSAVHDPWRGLQRANPGFPPTTVSWNLKPEPPQIDRRAELEERERERERQRREREELERQRREREREEHERQRREREELERQRREREREEQRERERREREKEEKRKQQEAAERERERRDKERREMERREMERERMMHQNRQNALMGRERSPLRNGTMDPSEVRVKEEPRSKDDDVVMLSRGPMQSQVPGPGQGGPSPIPDPRYHHPHHAYLAARHQHSLQTSHMSRSMMPTLSHTMQHFPPPPPPPPPSGPGGQPGGPWSSDPFRDPYRYDPLQQLRYNPLMAAAAFRAEEEERAKIYAGYQQSAGLRAKDPSPGPLSNLHMHHRAGPGPGAGQRQVDGMMHGDLHKKEDSSQSR